MFRNKRITGFSYFRYVLYICVAFAMELVLVMIERMFGVDINHSTNMQMICHWILTITLWVITGYVIINMARKTTGFDLFEQKGKLEKWQLMAIVVCFIVNIMVKYINWNGFKVLIEWQARGTLLFIFQYLYYIAEGFRISLLIVFGQCACEKWFKNDKIPYGGIVVGLTWGLVHIVSKGNIGIGILSACGGFLFGSVYLFTNKDYRKAMPIITLLFML